jgi:hypothetical protein
LVHSEVKEQCDAYLGHTIDATNYIITGPNYRLDVITTGLGLMKAITSNPHLGDAILAVVGSGDYTSVRKICELASNP